MKTVFLRVLESEDKAFALRKVIHSEIQTGASQRFEFDVDAFGTIPRSPFTYWVTDELRAVFRRFKPLRQQYFAVRGAYTTDDLRYYRLGWEVPPQRLARSRLETGLGRPFVRLAKGGSYSPYYTDLYLCIRWANDGREAKAFLSAYRERKGWGTDWSACLNGYDYYFRSGLTWPRRPHRKGWFAHVYPGAIFSDGGPMLFVEPHEHWPLCAVLNSAAFVSLLHFLMARGTGNSGQTLKYEVGYVTSVPVPSLPDKEASVLGEFARRAWRLRRDLDTKYETSVAFTVPALLQVNAESLIARMAAWNEHVKFTELEVSKIQEEIDEICFRLYGISESSRRSMCEGFGNAPEIAQDDLDTETEVEIEDGPESEPGSDRLGTELLSWAVCVGFGRFDVRLVTGKHALLSAADPFGPLPVCSPGILVGDGGLPPDEAPAGYPLSIPRDGVLVDDPGHPWDLTAAVRAVFKVTFGIDADDRWQEMASLLDPRERNLRSWLAKSFFEYHLKSYSKSRRKAPILWQLATTSASYSVWLYVHRLTTDSLFRVLNDQVVPKVQHEERKLNEMVQGFGAGPTVGQRNEIAAQASFVHELRTFQDEVARTAPLWNPDLDDGVIINMAPLWRLVPQHRGWQKECRSCWDRLAAGDYDWSQLAMHLWPERVVPKCQTDRSLAIAHGLEEAFWVEGSDGKWKPRSVEPATVAALIRERTSPAVKAALLSLEQAPAAGGQKERGRPAKGARKSEGGS